ncbi:isoprenoid biosynthesis glyoxalase ElbB [Candidatus Trichorickettsia mobilis]|uniref:isoprenoid biosynthesis glyoxalase ElbB n=1 Tax=Candidatus Trichorickettsia mobilis TaxID=1346319 RepID=UPI00292CAECE|nr:isoprenoid biosynthesis glyoxalase ElbB [Candidatus Trichorickettsia mobilis]
MIRVAVVISGCGALDGAEIFETVFTLLELDKNNVDTKIFAPDQKQHSVINHLTKEEIAEERNVLVESARIARGKIEALNKLQVQDFDALILPGGFGAATNLSDLAFKNENATVIEDLKKIIIEFHRSSKPIGGICIAPTILAAVLKNQAKIRITLGDKNELITKLDAIEEICLAEDIVIDKENKLVTTPAFMLNASLTQIHRGISKLVNKILKMHNNTIVE